MLTSSSYKKRNKNIKLCNTTSFTPDTKAYRKEKRGEIRQKQLAKNLFQDSANLDADDEYDPFN